MLLCLVALVAACSKTSTPQLTTDEQLEKDINLIDEYLAEKGINAIKLESGVRYVITENTDGPVATKDNCIRFLYAGYELYDTEPFDSNSTDGIKIPLKSLVAGMQIGLKLIPVGAKGMIYMPSLYGYGTSGNGTDVAPNTPIWFSVEVVELYTYNAEGNYCLE